MSRVPSTALMLLRRSNICNVTYPNVASSSGNASIHRDRRVKAYRATQPLISVEWLSAYAPELNPEEYCHANVKRHLKNATPLTSDDIQPLIDRGFARLRKRPDLILSFFHRAGLSVKDLWLT